MTNEPEPAPATDLVPVPGDDLKRALSFALTFDGRKRFHRADELMAVITAEHLVKHLELCGMVVLRKPPTTKSLMVGMAKARDE